VNSNIIYNCAYPKHKVCKVSSITDSKEIILLLYLMGICITKILENKLNECNLIDYNLNINNRQYLLSYFSYD
jgi:hypothetical protein